MPTTTLSAPTLIPCTRCAAQSWARPGQRQVSCEGCGETLEVAARPERPARRSTIAPAARPAPRATGRLTCQGCGRSFRLGQTCPCDAQAGPRPVPTARLESQAAHVRADVYVPAGLLAGGLLASIAFSAPSAGLVGAVLGSLLFTVIFVALGLFTGWFIGGSLFGWEMGDLRLGALKLAALGAFELGGDALAQAVGLENLGGLAVGITGFVLMMHFFKLGFWQCLAYRIAMSLVATGVMLTVLAAVVSA